MIIKKIADGYSIFLNHCKDSLLKVLHYISTATENSKFNFNISRNETNSIRTFRMSLHSLKFIKLF